jgi:hypothetical protein
MLRRRLSHGEPVYFNDSVQAGCGPMLGFGPKLPVDDEERLWVDQGLSRLEEVFGRSRMLGVKVILPDAKHFPDAYDGTPAMVEALFQRICGYMQVDRSRIELEVFPDETEELRQILPYWRGSSDGCAGLYLDDSVAERNEKSGNPENPRMLIALRSTLLKDPIALVATVAHELGHVILLGGGLMDHRTPDHEPMTDLLTVFLGFGIFTANSAERFRQFQDSRRQGWSMQRLGYLPQEVFGYALAKFASERGENKPAWVRHLSPNVRAFYKRSRAWLEKNSKKPEIPTS